MAWLGYQQTNIRDKVTYFTVHNIYLKCDSNGDRHYELFACLWTTRMLYYFIYYYTIDALIFFVFSICDCEPVENKLFYYYYWFKIVNNYNFAWMKYFGICQVIPSIVKSIGLL